MTSSEINTAYAEIEQSLHPVLDFLEKNADVKTIANNYKGFATVQSPIVYNPEILFIGINPGQGAFIEHKNNKREGYPIKLYNTADPAPLDWYKDGNARGEKINNDWYPYKWYERNKRINNTFVTNMIDLLYLVAAQRNPIIIGQENGEEPDWFKTFGQKVMFTNLYPIATTKSSDLKPIFSVLIKDPSIKTIFGGSGRLKQWDARRFFVARAEKLVSLVKPKVIVCLGTEAFNDFTFTSKKKTTKVFKTKKGDISVIGLDRLGNWSSVIPALADEIIAEI